MKNVIVWFDIPVTDMARAKKFYSAVLKTEIEDMPGSNGSVAVFPYDQDEGGVGGDLALGEQQVPGMQGATIYLDSGGDPDGMLKRAEEAGGTILMPSTFMGDMVGFIGFFKDSEGN